MISFTRGTLLKEEPCCKYMSKHDIRNYLRQLRSFASSEI